MRKKYIVFNNPATVLILVVWITALVIGVPILASLWRESDFAVAFFIACITVIMVNLAFTLENDLASKSELNSDKNQNSPD